MRWSEPQRAMLREMGLRLWLPPESGAERPAPAGAASAAASPALPVVAPASLAQAAPGAGRPPTPAALALPTALSTAVPTPMPTPAPASGQPARSAAYPVAAPTTLRSLDPASASPAANPALQTMDWPALRSAVDACRACTLCETRRQTVFGVGHPRAHCMVVGEAPGEQEDARGEPFVGESGQLLDRMLRALGLSREATAPADPARQVFIANTLKCRPPRNRNPSAAELAACQPFLERQVALVQPRVILAMGRFAVQSLLGSDEPIGKLRGRLHQWRGVPLVVTYHPAYLLRQPADKARAWDDLCLAASCLDQPPD